MDWLTKSEVLFGYHIVPSIWIIIVCVHNRSGAMGKVNKTVTAVVTVTMLYCLLLSHNVGIIATNTLPVPNLSKH